MNKAFVFRLKIACRNFFWDLYGHTKIRTVCIRIDQSKKEVIRRDEMAGLFSYVEICMRKAVLALKSNRIPVIDMCGCANPYLEKGEETETNWWELYFEQPVSGVSDTSIELPILGNRDSITEVPHSREGVLYKSSRAYWGEVYKRFFRLNRKADEYFENEYNELFRHGRLKVLGVLIRGTDYRGAKGHPIQPAVDQVVKAVRKIEFKYDRIYVASDEKKNVEILESEFPGKVITNKRQYYDGIDMSDRSINHVHFERENDRYFSGLEYLSSIMLLSRCVGLIGGICGGSVAAVYINNNNYKDLKLFYLGVND